MSNEEKLPVILYPDPLHIEVVPGTWMNELLKDYTCIYRGEQIVVPAGFRTNFASIPRFFKAFMDNDDPRIKEGAVLHDFLYDIRSLGDYSNFDRNEADLLLYRSILANGGKERIAKIVYWAVRIGGAGNYQQVSRYIAGES